MTYNESVTINGGVDIVKIGRGVAEVVGGVALVKTSPVSGVLAPLQAAAGVALVAKDLYDIYDGIVE